ncbi:MAG: hypothetical protein OIF38_15830 [Cellvibrionaceae bacterium]|nr:hypothetical protein [Cellvibrionaceae bacterium]
MPQPQHPAPQKQPSAPEPPPPVVLAEPQTAAPAAADAAQPPAPTVLPPAQAISWEQLSADNWFELYRQLKFGGVLQSTASNVVLQGRNGDELNFCLDQNNSHLYDTAHQGRMAQIIGAYFERPVSVLIKPGQPAQQTPAAIIAELKRQRQAEAEAAIATDPNIIRLIEEFDAKLVDDSVEPMGPDPLAN